MIEGLATCVLALSHVQLTSDDTGWREQATFTIDAEGPCPWVQIPLPDGVQIDKLKARISRLHGRSGSLGTERMQRMPRQMDGTGAHRIFTPDLQAGDRLTLELQRSWPVGPYPWAPTGFAELTVDAPSDPPDWAKQEDGGYWVEDGPGETWALPHPAGDTRSSTQLHRSGTARGTLTTTIQVQGDPMRALYPGGSSTFTTAYTFTEGEDPLMVPIPLDARDVEIDGAHTRWEDAVLLTSPAGSTVSWRQKDAPTYGMRAVLPGAELEHVIQGDRVRVEWEDGRSWYVSAVDLKPLLPERPRLIRALDNRFRRASNPEPALPASLRGKAKDLDFVAQLRPKLHERAGVGLIVDDPLFPRKLIKARGTHALTSVEAALILWTQLAQEQIPSAWAIVQPAPLGPGFFASPASYTDGVVGVQTPDGAVWIDTACRLCAPFELRPHLQGASMLSAAGRATPEPTEGRVDVADEASSEGTIQRTVTLTGPAALLERQRLAVVRPADRKAAIADQWCGDCTVSKAEGLAAPGEPITYVLIGAEVLDPLDATRFESAWPAWHDFVGGRSWKRPGQATSASWSLGDVHYLRQNRGDQIVEALSIQDRRLSPDLWSRWTTSRSQEIPVLELNAPEIEGDESHDGTMHVGTSKIGDVELPYIVEHVGDVSDGLRWALGWSSGGAGHQQEHATLLGQDGVLDTLSFTSWRAHGCVAVDEAGGRIGVPVADQADGGDEDVEPDDRVLQVSGAQVELGTGEAVPSDVPWYCPPSHDPGNIQQPASVRWIQATPEGFVP